MEGHVLAEIRIEEWLAGGSGDAVLARELDMLSDVLHAVVHVEAGVSLVVPFDRRRSGLLGRQGAARRECPNASCSRRPLA